jgi:P2-related tail formation protein
LLPDSTPETEKKMHPYLASQLITQRQADLFADATHRALVKEARAARKASAASAARPVLTRLRLILRFAVA